MRILFVLHQFFPEFQGGTERVALNLAQMAQRAGHHVQVLACRVAPAQASPHAGLPGAQALVVEGVPVLLLDRRRLPATADHGFEVDEPLCAELQTWLAEQRFDLVHALHGMRMATALAAVQRCGLPLVWTLTDFFQACYRVNLIDVEGRPCTTGPQGGAACAQRCATPAWTPQGLADRHARAHALLAYAQVRVLPSAFVQRQIAQAFPGLECLVLPHGVDLLAMAHTPPVPRHDERFSLGFIGSLQKPKGVQLLLAALALRPDAPLRLSVAGAFHGDAAFEAGLRAQAAADPRIELLGPLDAKGVRHLLQELDLLCLPSLVPETYSLVLHEAAAAGVPALVSDRGAPAELVREQGSGAVVDSDEPHAWAAAFDACLTEPERLPAWRRAVRLPMRIEEEAFLYESLYRQAAGRA
ncbi:glycosyltransferase [Inhella proteolytica]|uniref:Glycosyltransferase n=1 Tax=Inhella proteolytica TaxID=2795029 RepID=A0A931J8E6_9BURK|nr:glycosyltransferase [Inhella proteolytica]MBH9578010.1 glycosyltransferase [Inhella proteolytica]